MYYRIEGETKKKGKKGIFSFLQFRDTLWFKERLKPAPYSGPGECYYWFTELGYAEFLDTINHGGFFNVGAEVEIQILERSKLEQIVYQDDVQVVILA